MTFTEFKCWLEGFEEAFPTGYPHDGSPSGEQWKKIKEKLAEVGHVQRTRSATRAHIQSGVESSQ